MLQLRDVASTPREKAWNGALKARMNVVYYQRFIERTRQTDFLLRVTSGVFSAGGVVLAIEWLDNTAIAMTAGVIGAVCTVLTMVMGLHDRVREAAAILPRYVEHANRLIRLFLKEGATHDDVDAALLAMDQTEVVEAEKCHPPNRRLLDAAYEAICNEIGMAHPAPPTP